MTGMPIYQNSRGASLPAPARTEFTPPASPINTGLSIHDQISAAPEWLQSQMNSKLLKPQQAGYYDPALQLRDLYSGYLDQYSNYEKQYGQSFHDPYYIKNAGEFKDQIGDSYDPFSQSIFDYRFDDRGNVWEYDRDPFTGQALNEGRQVASYNDLAAWYIPQEFNHNTGQMQNTNQRLLRKSTAEELARFNQYAPYIDNWSTSKSDPLREYTRQYAKYNSI